MQVRGIPRVLYPGEPLCAPSLMVTIEATIALLRMLHSHSAWTDFINRAILTRLMHAGKLADMISQMSVGSETGKHQDAEGNGGKRDGKMGTQGEMSSGIGRQSGEGVKCLGECV